jgi:hypothetical protein
MERSSEWHMQQTGALNLTWLRSLGLVGLGVLLAILAIVGYFAISMYRHPMTGCTTSRSNPQSNDSGFSVVVIDEICDGMASSDAASPTTCSAPQAFDAMKAPDTSAPGAPAAQEGPTSRIDLPGITSPNPISQMVNTPAMTIVNTTLPGHTFYPGIVTIQVAPMGTGSTIDITGVGNGPNPVWNDFVGYLVFGTSSYLVQTGCDGQMVFQRAID